MNTRLEDIAFPESEITLEGLKQRDGSPVVILVRPASQLAIAAATGRNPGLFPDTAVEWDGLAKHEQVERTHQLAMLLIPMTCTPAVDTRYLTANDETAIVAEALKLSGWGGGPASEVAFPAGDGGGVVSGGRDTETVPENRDQSPPTLRLVPATKAG